MLKRRIKISKNGLIFIIVFIIVLIAYFGSPLSKVRDINVKGVNDLGAQQVINATKIDENSTLLDVLLHHGSISKKTAKKLSSIKSVTFRTYNLRDLVINVKEYPTLGYINKDGGYYRIIDNGRVLNQKLNSPIGNYPIYSNFNSGRLREIANIYADLPSNVQTNISEFYNSPTKLNPYRIKIDMNDGNKVIADMRTVKTKLKYYPGMAAQMKKRGVIDLEIGAYSYPFNVKK
ncbi:cell division protein DivIB [Companilactobacillus crustorum]|uniref:Cell division protein DivIB n=2 Tax=Companilactobacillus crustorum TaxID=392416 RepID=A0A837RIZ0_9LACO|nr:cell division protein FtsQ/DivIB [Companilactobacillus crustorum]KRK42774.1 cell division protein FtsQ [Companilactobacillus crustorum JCM 15951]KRO20428.1 cell division protein FtsQ [Companilactobacillus crustorum]GEO76414.1 cell division protein DivIB [Companilactobacillus crustorum]